MSVRSITRRLRPRFSLRALFIAVTLLCLWLGRDVNWINERHAFLARNTEEEAAYSALLPKWEEAQSRVYGGLDLETSPLWTVTAVDPSKESPGRQICYTVGKASYRQPGPSTLWLYGEDALYSITLVPSCGSFDSANGFEPTPDDLEKFNTARRLFPEADINWQ